MQILFQQMVNGLANAGTYALIAVGLTRIFGILDVVNFAHGEMYMLGAYFAYVFAVTLNLPFAASFFLSILGGMAVGVLAERIVFCRLQGKPHMNSVIASMGLSLVLANGALMIFTPTPRHIPPPIPEGSFEILGIYLSQMRALVFGVAVVLIVALNLFVERTWMGMGMRAVAQDTVVARLMGIDIQRVSIATFAIGSALAAAAGALVGPLLVVEPHMGGVAGLKAFAVVIMGGMGSIPGAIFAALILGLAEGLAAGFVGAGVKDLIAFVLMILILVFKPTGLWRRRAM